MHAFALAEHPARVHVLHHTHSECLGEKAPHHRHCRLWEENTGTKLCSVLPSSLCTPRALKEFDTSDLPQESFLDC